MTPTRTSTSPSPSTTSSAPRAVPLARRLLGLLQVGPIARISLGVAALFLALALGADLLLDAVPSQAGAELRVRKRVANNLVVQITTLLESGDLRALDRTLQQVLARDPSLRAIDVRRSDGSVVSRAGAPLRDDEPSAAIDRIRAPVLMSGRAWGEIDLRFVPSEPQSLREWLAQPAVQMMLVLGFGGLGLCYAYLRRSMHYLDPSSSVPDRVRKAFDVLSEGMVIIDRQSRIVLANRAFRQLHPHAQADLNGQRLDQLEWLLRGLPGPAGTPPPWQQTLLSRQAVADQALDVPQADGSTSRLLVSTAVIADAQGRVRGCLVSFNDVTAEHRANETLRRTLLELERSHQRIEEQNEELRSLASRDALTGCYNRRAFTELAAGLIAQACRENRELCCLMIDIDHFKRINDTHGHPVGDQVIQAVSRVLAATVRQADVLCRYGGEEFCVVLPDTSLKDALGVAERARVEIGLRVKTTVRDVDLHTVTASLGLTTLQADPEMASLPPQTLLARLIDQADQALYQSKQGGRNRVTTWEASA